MRRRSRSVYLGCSLRAISSYSARWRSRTLERPAVAVALIANEFARTRQALRATMAQNV
jgi:hypothetical protein